MTTDRRSLDYTSLDTTVSTLDQALYVASCMCGAWPNGIAHIYGTTNTEHADPTTGERYIILANDDFQRDHMPAFTLEYTLTRGPRD